MPISSIPNHAYVPWAPQSDRLSNAYLTLQAYSNCAHGVNYLSGLVDAWINPSLDPKLPPAPNTLFDPVENSFRRIARSITASTDELDTMEQTLETIRASIDPTSYRAAYLPRIEFASEQVLPFARQTKGITQGFIQRARELENDDGVHSHEDAKEREVTLRIRKDAIIDSATEFSMSCIELPRFPRPELERALIQAIETRIYDRPTLDARNTLVPYSQARLLMDEVHPTHIRTLGRLQLYGFGLNYLLTDPLMQEQFPALITKMADESDLLVRRSRMTINTYRYNWERLLEKRLEAHFNLFRIALAINTSGKGRWTKGIKRALETTFRDANGPDALRRSLQKLGGAYFSMKDVYHEFRRIAEETEPHAKLPAASQEELEVAIANSCKMWETVGKEFRESKAIAALHRQAISSLRHKDWLNPMERVAWTEEFAKVRHATAAYLEKIHRTLYPFVHHESEPLYPLGDLEPLSREDTRSIEEIAAEMKRVDDKRSFISAVVVEFDPTLHHIPDIILEKAYLMQTSRMQVKGEGAPDRQNALQTPVSKEAMRKYLEEHGAIFFAVIDPQARRGEEPLRAIFILEQDEEKFSYEGMKALKHARKIPALKNAQLKFLGLTVSAGGKYKAFESDIEQTGLEMQQNAVIAAANGEGDLLKDQAIIAWVREDNSAIDIYEKRGWVRTGIWEEFVDIDPETGQEVLKKYELIYLKTRTVDPGLQGLRALRDKFFKDRAEKANKRRQEKLLLASGTAS